MTELEVEELAIAYVCAHAQVPWPRPLRKPGRLSINIRSEPPEAASITSTDDLLTKNSPWDSHIDNYARVLRADTPIAPY